MPIYEYACTHCEHAFDELQKITEAALVHCPQCGEPSLRKLLSAPKFRLKGKGWYETDFKTGDKRNLHGESEPSGKNKDADTKKSDADSKPESSSPESSSKSSSKTSTEPSTALPAKSNSGSKAGST